MAEGNYCIIGFVIIGIIIFISFKFLKSKNEPSETISLLEESPQAKLAVDEEIRRVTPPDKLNGLFWKDDF